MGDSVGDSWQGEGMLTPTRSVGTLTTIPSDSFFLDMKGKGCEIKEAPWRWHQLREETQAGVGVISDHFGAISEQQRLNL